MSKLYQRWMLSIAALATLGACANLPGQTHPANAGWTPSLIVTSQAEELLLYYDYARKLPTPDLVREYDKARQNMALAKTEVNRLRLALLLSLPGAPFHDNAAALALANEQLKDIKSTNPGLHGLAGLLAVSLADQQRTSDELMQKLKDEQKRADSLQDKVDAIKNMEKNLIRRDQH
ncbi:MAG: dihydrolipoamide acyltransferase [Sulfuriferula sp.]|nr:dihydrolipoamide acyltransferase [Sulfuriferula sp.]